MSIEIKNIVKRFGDFTALNNVSLTVKDGELIALLGPSGSGKTTLLRIIGGIEFQDAGDITIDGVNSMELNARNRRVGFVFQHYALFRHMTVFENIAFGLKVRPKSTRPAPAQIKEKVFTLLKLIQLERLAERYPHQLSGGQKQRVALARALAVEPRVLLLDEPFGSLDAKVRRDLRQWLRRLHKEVQVTSVFVTHDQEEALEVADRVVIINEGQIQQIGTPNEVYHKPANAFVYNFLGNVNLFHSRIEDGKVFLGDTSLDLKTEMKEDPKAGVVYVRPHLLEIRREAAPQSIRAQINAINAAGPLVKCELLSDAQDVIQVEISHERFRELVLKKNEIVFVSPKNMPFLSEDYSI